MFFLKRNVFHDLFSLYKKDCFRWRSDICNELHPVWAVVSLWVFVAGYGVREYPEAFIVQQRDHTRGQVLRLPYLSLVRQRGAPSPIIMLWARASDIQNVGEMFTQLVSSFYFVCFSQVNLGTTSRMFAHPKTTKKLSTFLPSRLQDK